MIRKTQTLICKYISEHQCHDLTRKQTPSSISDSFLLVTKCFLSHAHTLDGQSSPKMSPSDTEQAPSRNSATGPPGSSLKRLRSSCVVVRMDDVDIHQASFNDPLIWFTCSDRSLTSVNGLRDSSVEAVRQYLWVTLHLEHFSSDKAVTDGINIDETWVSNHKILNGINQSISSLITVNLQWIIQERQCQQLPHHLSKKWHIQWYS